MESVIDVKKVVRKTKQKAAAANSDKACAASVFAQRVEKKAYELYEQRGGQHGSDWEDWFKAQRLVEEEIISGK